MGTPQWPSALKTWLANSIKNDYTPRQTKQAQQELKTLIQRLTNHKEIKENKNIVWRIDWPAQPSYVLGNIDATFQNLIDSTKKPTVTAMPPPSREHQYFHDTPSSSSSSQYPPPQLSYESSYMQQQQQPLPPPPYSYMNTNHPYQQQQPYPLYNQYQQQAYSYPPPPTISSSSTTTTTMNPPIGSQPMTDPSAQQFYQKFHHNTIKVQGQQQQQQQQQEGEENPNFIPIHHPTTHSLSPTNGKNDNYNNNKRDWSSGDENEMIQKKKAVRAFEKFLAKTKGKRLHKTKLNLFYDAYPKHKLVIQGRLNEVLQELESKAQLENDHFQLPFAAPSSSDTRNGNKRNSSVELDDDPEKKAARAARFKSMPNSNSTVTTTDRERTMQEYDRVSKMLQKADEDGKEIDWSTVAIKGTCKALEKGYIRLTAPPDPSTVRPERILRKALANIVGKLSKENYAWCSDQLKAIRSDLLVQHINNHFTMEVYETHARAALQFGGPDFQEFNQCLTQVKYMHKQGIGSQESMKEFSAYAMLYHVYCKLRHQSGSSIVSLSFFRVRGGDDNKNNLKDPEVHAHRVHLAATSENWSRMLILCKNAPNLGGEILGYFQPLIQLNLLQVLCRGGAKSVPVEFVMRTLGFSSEEFDLFKEKYQLKMMENNDVILIDTKGTLQSIDHAFKEHLIWN